MVTTLLGMLAMWSPSVVEAVPSYDVEFVGNGFVAAINSAGDIPQVFVVLLDTGFTWGDFNHGHGC